MSTAVHNAQALPTGSRTERKLVTVRPITSVTKPRDSQLASRYDLLSVDGWEVLEPCPPPPPSYSAGGGGPPRFAAGELVVYFEIDSFVPATDGNFWEDVATGGATTFRGTQGVRVRTRKLRGVVSQGRVFRLVQYPAIRRVVEALEGAFGLQEGRRQATKLGFDDLVGVVKWELSAEERCRTYGPPPDFFPRPGANRVQDERRLFETAGHVVVQVTEKLDGIPISVYYVRRDSEYFKFLSRIDGEEGEGGGPAAAAVSVGGFSSLNGIGGETGEVRAGGAPEPSGEKEKKKKLMEEKGKVLPGTGRVGVTTTREDLVPGGGSLAWDVVEELGIPGVLRREDVSLVVQGELCGSSVLENSMGYLEGQHEFFAFSIWDVEAGRYVQERKAADLCRRLGIPHVPVLGYHRLRDLALGPRELVAMADGVGMRGEGHLREGFVLKNTKEGVFLKAISNEWLLRYGF